MLVRGDSYSGTGLVGLAILYDEYFEHIKALKLVEYFSTHDLPHVAYYCQLRELNPQKKEFAFIQGPGDLVFCGLAVRLSGQTLLCKQVREPWPVRNSRLSRTSGCRTMRTVHRHGLGIRFLHLRSDSRCQAGTGMETYEKAIHRIEKSFKNCTVMFDHTIQGKLVILIARSMFG
jgi:hypothetical protein